jgi:hypothetical protein
MALTLTLVMGWKVTPKFSVKFLFPDTILVSQLPTQSGLYGEPATDSDAAVAVISSNALANYI